MRALAGLHLAADLPRLAGRYDAVNIKLDKTGGLTEALVGHPGRSRPAVPDQPSGRGRTDSINSGSFMVQLRAELSDSITADYTYDYTKSDQTPPFSQLLRVNRNRDPRDIFDPASVGYAYGGAYFFAAGAFMSYWPVWLHDRGVQDAEIGTMFMSRQIVSVVSTLAMLVRMSISFC